jgi:hypothetical protein
MHYGYVVVAAALLVGFAIPYLAPHPPSRTATLLGEIQTPNMGRGGTNFLYTLAASAIASTNVSHKNIRRADWDRAHITTVKIAGYPFSLQLFVRKAGLVQLPVFYYPGMIQVRDNDRAIGYANLDARVGVFLEPGNHIISTRFIGVAWANMLSLSTMLLSIMSVFVFAVAERKTKTI